ncbi:MAG: Y-family DNA polymerase [Spirochaetota bacterium]|nr:Y-family DNA polymerase [Spirochaetota bacterium]
MREIFALVDCNNFYVSCEGVFNPQLWGRPVIVLSNNDGNVISRSNEAKELGIAMGAPLFECAKLVRKHDVKLFSSNYALYGNMSYRVMQTLAQCVPDMEIYSIDEAFLSFTGMSHLDTVAYGHHIKDITKQWTGIPVSIGIGPSKTLAKLASLLAKRHPQHRGVFDITEHPDYERLLDSVDVKDVWGIGSQYEKMLKRNGVNTAFQLAQSPDAWVRKRMTIMGLRTVCELRGVSCIPLEQMPDPKKGIFSSRSFGRPVEKLGELKEALAAYTARAAEKLRLQDSVASYINVFIATNRFKQEPQYSNSITYRLPVPTSYTPELIRYAHNSLDRIFRSGYRYKKTGIMLMEIIPKEDAQLNLFMPSGDTERERAIMKTIDYINARWGRNTVRYAAEGSGKPWQMRRSYLSKGYTTRWQDIPLVKASYPF